jgi:hypothetical protein
MILILGWGVTVSKLRIATQYNLSSVLELDGFLRLRRLSWSNQLTTFRALGALKGGRGRKSGVHN